MLNANSLFGQNNNRFIFASSYGLSYIDYGGKFYALPPEFETNNIVTDINSIGTVMGFELDYNIKNNNYVGVGFSRQHHSKKVNNTFYFNNNEFTLDNYQSNLNKTLIDIRYKRVYKYFTWSAGLFYFWESYATPSIYTNDSGGVNIILDNSYNNKEKTKKADIQKQNEDFPNIPASTEKVNKDEKIKKEVKESSKLHHSGKTDNE